MKKRILFSNEFFDCHRGSKDFILANQLVKMGHDVALIRSQNISIEDENAGYKLNDALAHMAHGVQLLNYFGIRFIRKTSNKNVSFVFPNPVQYIWRLFRWQPDILIDVIFTTLTPRSLLNGFYCRLFKKKYILIDPGDEGNFSHLMPTEKATIRSAEMIVTCSQASANRIIKKYDIQETQKVRIQQKFIGIEDFTFIPDRVSPKCVVGYVGRFLQSKGFSRYIELSERYKNMAQFIAVGVNEDDFDIPDHISVRPHIDNLSLKSVYSEIDILILPDLSQFKSYPTVVQEALLCGCDVWVGMISESYFPNPRLIHFFEFDNLLSLEVSISLYQRLDLVQKRYLKQRFSNFVHTEMDIKSFCLELAA